MDWIYIICILTTAILWTGPESAMSILQDEFTHVPHVPGATTVSTVPYVFQTVYCANRCVRQDSCHGFLMVLTEVHPCRLLIGLDGTISDPDPNIKAFVTLYYDGAKHYRRTKEQSWNNGLAFCQSLGMTMVSYPLTMAKRNWLSALNPEKLLIGAKKNPDDNNNVYDINTNNVLEVDWNTDEGIWQRNTIVLFTNKFGSGNDWYTWTQITLVCEPVSSNPDIASS